VDTTEIDAQKLQHDSQYRDEVIAGVAEKCIEIAEEEEFETTFSEIVDENPSLVEPFSKHVQKKIESRVEQRITQERIETGEAGEASSVKC
jgi:hypothetical protein